MPSPVEYADQYRKMSVNFDDGAITIGVNSYHEGVWDQDADKLIDKVVDDFNTQKKKTPTYSLTVKVNGNPVTFREVNTLRRCLQYAFEGKGSPEDCQVAAQMAVLKGKTTKANLQKYCDDHMGLDCTGFVGNYLWYVQGVAGVKTWPGENKIASNETIDTILYRTQPVSGLEDLNPGDLHVLGLLGPHDKIVGKDSAAAHAHIVMSQPGKFTPMMFITNFFSGSHLPADSWGRPGIWCVESTGGMGLTESWYAVAEEKDAKGKIKSVQGKPAFKVFKIYRGSKKQWLYFTIGAL